MIASLTGAVRARSLEGALIDVGGIGFAVALSSRTIDGLPPAGETCTLLTYMQVSDTGVSLFGFADQQEKALFEQLITVHGIGPKAALSALSALSPEELTRAVLNEDVKALQRIPGIGKKTASRIVVELKGSLADALASWPELLESAGALAPERPMAAAETEDSVLEALRSMGFTDTEVTLALNGAPEGADEVTLIQYALKRLGG